MPGRPVGPRNRGQAPLARINPALDNQEENPRTFSENRNQEEYDRLRGRIVPEVREARRVRRIRPVRQPRIVRQMVRDFDNDLGEYVERPYLVQDEIVIGEPSLNNEASSSEEELSDSSIEDPDREDLPSAIPLSNPVPPPLSNFRLRLQQERIQQNRQQQARETEQEQLRIAYREQQQEELLEYQASEAERILDEQIAQLQQQIQIRQRQISESLERQRRQRRQEEEEDEQRPSNNCSIQ
jgi:hypothetical protein